MRLFVDQLTNLDFSYLDATRGVVGETWLANIELEGELDEQGMVVDFGNIKKIIRNWLDSTVDHKLLVPLNSPSLTHTHNDDSDHIIWQYSHGFLETQAPTQSHCHIPCKEITPTSVAAWCAQELKQYFPESVQKLTLSFTSEVINGPYYHYTHGLKRHLGNCQRIAHGHRSRIDIWQDGELSNQLMHDWARKWADIYVGTAQDCLPDEKRAENHLFRYKAQQGEFEISLPKTSCYIMPTDTTVELIADHIASTLKEQLPKSSIKVRAYEGIAKGAIVEKP